MLAAGHSFSCCGKRIKNAMLFPVGADLHADSADCSPADVLEVIFHIIAALFRVKHIFPFTSDLPHITRNSSAGASPDAFVATAAKVKGYHIRNIKRTVGEYASQTHPGAVILMQKH